MKNVESNEVNNNEGGNEEDKKSSKEQKIGFFTKRWEEIFSILPYIDTGIYLLDF